MDPAKTKPRSGGMPTATECRVSVGCIYCIDRIRRGRIYLGKSMSCCVILYNVLVTKPCFLWSRSSTSPLPSLDSRSACRSLMTLFFRPRELFVLFEPPSRSCETFGREYPCCRAHPFLEGFGRMSTDTRSQHRSTGCRHRSQSRRLTSGTKK